MSKILVTGGAGMIGSNLVRQLVIGGHEVIVVDNLWRGKIENLIDDTGNEIIDLKNNFYQYDLSVPNVLDEIIQDIDYVYHLADIVAGIEYVFNNQSEIFRQNILINSNTINSLRNSKIKGLVYVGTACSFPANMQNTYESMLLKEEDLYPAYPESAYGWSKLMGEFETKLFSEETKIPSVTLILHNVYGSPTDYLGPRSQVIPSLIRKAINHPIEEFIVWGSGNQGRAFLHVDDAVSALILGMKQGLDYGVIQIGPSECTTIRNIAEEIVKISKKDITIKYDNTRPEGDKSRAADFSKAKQILGWEPKINMHKGLEQLYNWISNKIKINN